MIKNKPWPSLQEPGTLGCRLTHFHTHLTRLAEGSAGMRSEETEGNTEIERQIDGPAVTVGTRRNVVRTRDAASC